MIIWVMAGVAAVMLALILYSVLVIASRTDDAIERHFEKRPVKHREPILHSQTAKADAGKPRLSLVPMQGLYYAEKIRQYGIKKYGDPDNWKRVEPQRYWEACLRHVIAAAPDYRKTDPESGEMHISHALCNLLFLFAMMEEKERKTNERSDKQTGCG